ILANGLRAYGIILLAWLTDGELAAGVDHILYGWIFFSLVTLALMAGGWAFRQSSAGTPKLEEVAPSTSASFLRLGLAASLVLVLLAAPRGFAAYLEHRVPATARVATLPEVAAPWSPSTPGRSSWHPEFIGADLTLQQRYQRGGGATGEVFIA